MKNKLFLASVSILIMFASSCTSTYYSNVSNKDELYGGEGNGIKTVRAPRPQKPSAREFKHTTVENGVQREREQYVGVSSIDMEEYSPGSFAAALNGESVQMESSNSDEYYDNSESSDNGQNGTVNVNVVLSPSWAMGAWGGWAYSPSWTIYSSWYNPWYSWNSPYSYHYNPWHNPWYNNWYNPWYSPYYNPYYYPHYNRPIHRPYYSAGYGGKWNRPYYGGSTRYNRSSKGHSYERMYNSGVQRSTGRRTGTMVGSNSSDVSGSRYFDRAGRTKNTNTRPAINSSNNSTGSNTSSTTQRRKYTRSATRPTNNNEEGIYQKRATTTRSTTTSRSSSNRGSSSSFNRGSSSSSSFNRGSSSSSSFNRGSSGSSSSRGSSSGGSSRSGGRR